MAAIVQSPLLFGSEAIELATGTWRKRLLPVGQVEYKGMMLNFDRDYLEKLAKAFNSGAYDQVPFQLADHANTHTNDPERYRGEVLGMAVKDDGLYVTITTTPEGNALLEANPKLGVSARIVEDYARSDGNYYPAAVQHVLGTLDPRIPQLGSWEPVEMSNGHAVGPDMVIDLSTSVWHGEPAYDFAGSGSRTAGKLRALSTNLAARHPDLGASVHVSDAADAIDRGDHDSAVRHLNAAIGNFAPTSLRRHGMLTDAEHNGAKASMDEVHRHLLLVKEDRDAQATDRQPDVKARTDVTQPVPSGSQRMGTYASDYDYGVLDFAEQVSEMNQAVERAYRQAEQRQAEDAARPMRRRGGTSGVSEDRLAYALDRIGRGSYMPTQAHRNMGLANDDSPGSHSQGCSCGATGGNGQTVSRFHTAGCEDAMSGDEQAEYRTSGIYGEIAAKPFKDANGTTWRDQNGQPMTATDHFEQATGQRVTRTPFNGLNRPELSRADTDYDGGARALAAQLGLGDHRAAREESRRRAFDHLVQRPPQRFRTYGEQLEHGETTRERSARHRVPYGSGLVATGWTDGVTLPGELIGLTRANTETIF